MSKLKVLSVLEGGWGYLGMMDMLFRQESAWFRGNGWEVIGERNGIYEKKLCKTLYAGLITFVRGYCRI